MSGRHVTVAAGLRYQLEAVAGENARLKAELADANALLGSADKRIETLHEAKTAAAAAAAAEREAADRLAESLRATIAARTTENGALAVANADLGLKCQHLGADLKAARKLADESIAEATRHKQAAENVTEYCRNLAGSERRLRGIVARHERTIASLSACLGEAVEYRHEREEGDAETIGGLHLSPFGDAPSSGWAHAPAGSAE